VILVALALATPVIAGPTLVCRVEPATLLYKAAATKDILDLAIYSIIVYTNNIYSGGGL